MEKGGRLILDQLETSLKAKKLSVKYNIVYIYIYIQIFRGPRKIEAKH